MAKSSFLDNAFLKLIFQAVGIANLADNTATSPLTNLYVSLHTADPGAGGSQSTNEISYTGYARVAIIRTATGWTVTTNSVSPAAAINFPASTGGTGGTASFAAIGTAASGAGNLLWSGALNPNIAITSGVTPQITTASTITET